MKTTKAIAIYAGSNMGSMVGKAVTNLSIPHIVEPINPVDPNNPIQMKKWEKHYNLFLTKQEKLDKLFWNLI